MAEDTVLKIYDTNTGDALAPGKPKEIRRMIVAQRPCRPHGEDILNSVTPKLDESRFGARGELRASDIRRIPIEQQFDFDGKRIDVIDWDPVGLFVVDRQSIGKTGAVQISKHRERGGITVFDDPGVAG